MVRGIDIAWFIDGKGSGQSAVFGKRLALDACSSSHEGGASCSECEVSVPQLRALVSD